MSHPHSDPTDLHRLRIELPDLPQPLVGLTILHLTDTHFRRPQPHHEAMIDALARLDYDLLVLTGDYMYKKESEKFAADQLRRLAETARPRLATLAVGGNHDNSQLLDACAPLPITWLHDAHWSAPDLPLDVVGVDCRQSRRDGDLLAALPPGPPAGRCRLLLAHLPTWLPAAGSLGIDLVLAGHTHGGQVRLPIIGPLRNSMPWPLRLTSGIFRYRATTMLVSRGIGEVWIDRFRLFCPRQAPLITLAAATESPEPTDRVERIVQW